MQPNAIKFSTKVELCRNTVGRTPWSARVPLDPLFVWNQFPAEREGPARGPAGRGRDDGYPPPPAQTRARAPNAHGSHLGDRHAQAIATCTCSLQHCIAPVFSGTVSSIGPCLGISSADRLPSTCSADSSLPLFADFVGTMRSLDSPPPFMKDLWFITFSLRPAHCSRAATGSPGSRA